MKRRLLMLVIVHVLNLMKLVKEIKSKAGDIHFKRYQLFGSKYFNIYLHCIYKEDLDLHLHSHPWSFISMVLSGGYIEERHLKGFRWRYPGSVAYTPSSTAYHKIQFCITPTYTLVITGPRTDNWGYITEEGYVQNTEYRRLKNEGYWVK